MAHVTPCFTGRRFYNRAGICRRGLDEWRDTRKIWDISQELRSNFKNTMKCCLSLYSLCLGENVFTKTSMYSDYLCFALIILDSHMSILKSKMILVFCDHVFSHASEKL